MDNPNDDENPFAGAFDQMPTAAEACRNILRAFGHDVIVTPDGELLTVEVAPDMEKLPEEFRAILDEAINQFNTLFDEWGWRACYHPRFIVWMKAKKKRYPYSQNLEAH